MRYKGLPIRLNQNQRALSTERGSLIRCEYCGMAYDGDVYDNCPHCLGPRPDGVTPNLDEARRHIIDWDRDEPEDNVIYADNKVFYTVRLGPMA